MAKRVNRTINSTGKQTVTPEQLFETPHRSPQPPLFDLEKVSA
jgi:hypothetical protein